MKSKKKPTWFRKIRGSYLPKTWQGLAIYAIYVTYLIVVLVDAVQNQTSVFKAVLFIFPQWVGAIVVVTWVANKKS